MASDLEEYPRMMGLEERLIEVLRIMLADTVLASTSYAYPDGSWNSKQPTDGQIFIEFDHRQNPKKTWMWDDHYRQWFEQTAKTVYPGVYSPKKQVNSVGEMDLTKEFERLVSEHKCECGSEKVGAARHSNWCKKFLPE